LTALNSARSVTRFLPAAIARAMTGFDRFSAVRYAPDESQRAQRVIFTGWQPSFSASSFLFSAYLHDPCLKYAMKRRRCCESRGPGAYRLPLSCSPSISMHGTFNGIPPELIIALKITGMTSGVRRTTVRVLGELIPALEEQLRLDAPALVLAGNRRNTRHYTADLHGGFYEVTIESKE